MRRTRTAGLVGLLTCTLAVALILATSREPAPSARAPEGLVERGQEPAASLAAPEDATHPEEPTQERAAAPASAPEPVAREATARRAILSGRVLQNEAPLADCVVVIGGDRGVPPARCTTDSDGRFIAADLPPGTYTLAFFGATVPQPWTKRFLRVPAGEPVDLGDLEISRGGEIRGRVADESGRPLAGIAVLLELPSPSRPSFDRATPDLAAASNPSVLTGPDGGFAFAPLTPGRRPFRLLLEPGAHTDLLEREVEARLDGALADLGVITLQRGTEARGRVVDADGAALAEARVSPDADGFGMPARRRGVLTDAGGAFALRGLRKGASVVVEAAGYQPQSVPVRADGAALVVALHRACAVHGVVTGQGSAPAVVVLDRDAAPPVPHWFLKHLFVQHPVAADGAFRIDDLPAGSYRMIALADGFGSSEPVAFTLPRADDAPFELAIVPGVSFSLRVVDDAGARVAGARVIRALEVERAPPHLRIQPGTGAERILARWRSVDPEVRTDADGIAHLRAESWATLALAVLHDDYFEAALAVEARSGSATVVLARAGRIRGTLDDPSGREHFALKIEAHPIAVEDRVRAAVQRWPVDAAGRFASGAVAPGRYRVAVARFDASRDDDPSRGVADPRPLLGAGTDPRDTVEVEVAAGQTVDVALHARPIGTVRGTVFVRGAPAAGAIVYAVEADRAPGPRKSWDDADAYQLTQHAIADASGRFAFAYALPGAWDLRARAPDAQQPTAPVRVAATDFGQELVQDLAVAGAEITGRLDFEACGLAPDDRARVRAYLFPLARADGDPVASGMHVVPPTARMVAAPLDSSGSYALRDVPDGDFVVRIIASLKGKLAQRVLVQRVVRVAAQSVDLGELRPVTGVRADWPCRDARVGGVWLRQAVPGAERGVFVATVRVHGGRIELPELEPGSYLAEPFTAPTDFRFPTVGAGRSFGVLIPLRVGAEGALDPPQLVLPPDADADAQRAR